jgi:hypothetical protein
VFKNEVALASSVDQRLSRGLRTRHRPAGVNFAGVDVVRVQRPSWLRRSKR